MVLPKESLNSVSFVFFSLRGLPQRVSEWCLFCFFFNILIHVFPLRGPPKLCWISVWWYLQPNKVNVFMCMIKEWSRKNTVNTCKYQWITRKYKFFFFAGVSYIYIYAVSSVYEQFKIQCFWENMMFLLDSTFQKHDFTCCRRNSGCRWKKTGTSSGIFTD